MLNRRSATRAALGGLAAALAVAGLAGCRTDPNVAAYVGGDTISVHDVQTAVAQRTSADPDLAAYARSHTAQYPRQVLGYLIDREVYADAEQHYDVHVDDAAVRSELATLLQGSDPTQAYQQAAAEGVGRSDLFELVRERLVLLDIARARGLAGPLSEASLRAAYQKNQQQYAARSFGYIDAPDQATAAAVLKQLTADPNSYAAVAAQHPGQLTLPQMVTRTSDQFPQELAQGIASAAPNTGFTVAGPSGDVVVCFVGAQTYLPFEQVRPQLQQAAEQTVLAAAQQEVGRYRSTLHVTVNPRYGVLGQNGALTDPTSGVVRILGTDSGAAASGAASGAAAGTAGG